MGLNSICGLMNSGKTLYTTLRLYKDYLDGRTIVSNYDLAFPHIKINKDVLVKLGETSPDLLDFFNCKSLSMGFDEIWIWLDCRDTQLNKTSTYMFLQSAKDDVNIYFTQQEHTQTELRLRNNVSTISICDRVLVIDEKPYVIDSERRFLSPSLLPYLYIRVQVYKKVQVSFSTQLQKVKTEYIRVLPITMLYNTRNKVQTK